MTKEPKITLLGGKGEIGGNKMLVEYKDTRIFLDFGMSFNQNSKYFSEFLNPRKAVAISDYFEMGLLPDLTGVYREDYLRHMDRPAEDREIDAVFLSHAHADHSQYIHFLRPDIPIYCTEETHILLEAMETTGSSNTSDITKGCEAFTFYINARGGTSRVTSKQRKYLFERDYHAMEPDHRVRIGDLEVEMCPVDHSVPGACAYIIYTDEGNIVYTGDIRFHGYNQHLSEEFVKKAAHAAPKWLLCEGTRINDNQMDSEETVKSRIGAIIKNSKDSLVFVEHPIRDTDRVRSIYEATIANGREFVVDIKLAYLLESLGTYSSFSVNDVKILIPKKGWGLLNKNIEESLKERDYAIWERHYIFRTNSINAEEIRDNPGKYLVSMNLWGMNQLSDIQPHNAVWIKSSCEPFSDEMNIDEERKKNWLKHFGIEEFNVHASGHASGDEIQNMIKRIKPEHLIPIHTEHPEMFPGEIK